MPDNVIVSNGISDTSLYLQAAANVKPAFDVQPQSGQYPALGDIAMNRKLADRWLAMFLDAKIFADGKGLTVMNATEEGAIAVRIPMLRPAPRNARTLAVNLGGGRSLKGTEGNDNAFNNHLPNGAQTDAVDIFFRQIYDEAMQIAKSSMRAIGSNLDVLAKYTSTIPSTVALLEDADVIANQVGAGLKRLADGNNGNIVYFNPATGDAGYLQGVLNTLCAKLSNVVGGYKEGVVSYPADKSVIVMRYSLWSKLLTINNGAIVNSDIGQKILINGKFTDDGQEFLGGAIMGKYNGIYIKVVPDELWHMAAAYLGLSSSDLTNFDKVQAYIANADGTYFGRAAVGVEVDKSPTTSQGFIVRNDWQWGAKVVRPSSIALLISSANSGVDFDNPISGTEYDLDGETVAAADMEGLLESYAGDIADSSFQAIGVSNDACVCTLTLTDALSADIDEALVKVVAAGGARVSVSNNGDGTYTFTLGRGETATAYIKAEGYVDAVLDIAATDTAEATKALSKTLVAGD